MAKIRLIDVEYQNFLSYGANITRMEFTEGLNVISGTNGNGKSAAIEAIHFALFGEPYRNIVLGELVNTYNKRRLLVSLTFARESSVTEWYKIVRGLAPKKLEVWKKVSEDGEFVKIPTDAVAGNMQTYIQDTILGFNSILSKNSITMSAMGSIPFLEMKTDAKRKFMDSILGMSDLAKVKKAFAEEMSSARTDFKVASSELPVHQSNLENLEVVLKNAINEKKRGIEQLSDEIKTYESDIVTLTADKEKHEELRDTLLADGKRLSDEQGDLKEVPSTVSKLESKVTTLNKRNAAIEVDVKKLTKEIGSNGEYSIDTLTAMQDDYDTLMDSLSDYDSVSRNVMSINLEVQSHTREIDRIDKEKGTQKAGVPCITCGKPSTEDDISHICSALDDRISEHNKAVTKLKKELTVANKKLKKLDAVKKSSDELRDKISNYKIGLANHKNSMDRLESLNKELSDNNEQISDANKTLDELKPKLAHANIINAKLTDLRTDYLEAKNKVESVQTLINEKLSHIKRLNSKIEEYNNMNVDGVIETTEKKIEDVTASIASTKQKIKDLSNKVEMLKYIQDIFGDEGIKEYMMKKYVPILNKSIENIIAKFNLQYKVEFDSNMEVKFESPIGSAPSYGGLSGGQKVRVDFSIYMAFREFINKIGRFSINVLFLDELLDTAVDNDGLADMISIVNECVDSVGCIYLISHRGEALNTEFAREYYVTHDGSFSTLHMR